MRLVPLLNPKGLPPVSPGLLPEQCNAGSYPGYTSKSDSTLKELWPSSSFRQQSLNIRHNFHYPALLLQNIRHKLLRRQMHNILFRIRVLLIQIEIGRNDRISGNFPRPLGFFSLKARPRLGAAPGDAFLKLLELIGAVFVCLSDFRAPGARDTRLPRSEFDTFQASPKFPSYLRLRNGCRRLYDEIV
jgi:hypothetical protein